MEELTDMKGVTTTATTLASAKNMRTKTTNNVVLPPPLPNNTSHPLLVYMKFYLENAYTNLLVDLILANLVLVAPSMECIWRTISAAAFDPTKNRNRRGKEEERKY